jgi:hypothetical protein
MAPNSAARGTTNSGRVLLRHARPHYTAAPWPTIAPPRTPCGDGYVETVPCCDGGECPECRYFIRQVLISGLCQFSDRLTDGGPHLGTRWSDFPKLLDQRLNSITFPAFCLHWPRISHSSPVFLSSFPSYRRQDYQLPLVEIR